MRGRERDWADEKVLEGPTGRNDGEDLASSRHTLDGVSATRPTRSRVLSGASRFRTIAPETLNQVAQLLGLKILLALEEAPKPH